MLGPPATRFDISVYPALSGFLSIPPLCLLPQSVCLLKLPFRQTDKCFVKMRPKRSKRCLAFDNLLAAKSGSRVR
jgi:hypothetical protein